MYKLIKYLGTQDTTIPVAGGTSAPPKNPISHNNIQKIYILFVNLINILFLKINKIKLYKFLKVIINLN